MPEFLHARRDFAQLLALVADERGLDLMLVEKGCWIMHGLLGLQTHGSVSRKDPSGSPGACQKFCV